MDANDKIYVETEEIINLALAEDRADDDITSRLIIPENLNGTATLLSKAPGILAGTGVFKAVFLSVDKKLKIEIRMQDGSVVTPGDVAAVISGSARSILRAERTAMNFLCHLSGVATAASV